MKKSIMIFIAFFIFFHTFAQIERKKRANYKIDFTEKYEVLKSNKKLRDGPYILSYDKDTIIQGFYKENNKDGLWTFFNSKGNVEFKYDFTLQKLIYWNENSEVDIINLLIGISKEPNKYPTYISGKVIPFSYSDTKKQYLVINKTEMINTFLDQPPLYQYGSLLFQIELFKIIRNLKIEIPFPSQCMISFIIDENGSTRDYKIVIPSGRDYENEFLKRLEEKDFKWIPGKIKDQKVTCVYSIPILTISEVYNKSYMHNYLIFNEVKYLDYIKNLDLIEYKHFSGKDIIDF